MHLALFNVAKLRAPMDDPLIDDFRDNLDPINALAEQSPGFVWRLQDDSGNATNITPYPDPMVITNMAVWESIDALADFTYRSGHLEFLRRRRDFFEPPSDAILVLWWVPEGHLPTMEEAMERLDHLREHGPTPHAFTFRHRYEPGDDQETQGSDLDTCPAYAPRRRLFTSRPPRTGVPATPVRHHHGVRTVACSRPPSPTGATGGSPWSPAHSGHGVAVFDLDRTLIRGSSLSRYGRELVARGLVPKGTVARHALAELTFRRRGIGTARVDRLVTLLLAAAAGRDAEPLAAVASDMGRALAADVSPAARFLVDQHLLAGDFCVVLSASPYELVEAISVELGAHRAIGTRIEVVDGVLTGRLDGPLCYGAAKLDALEREVGLIDLTTATAYADSASDLPLLASCGTAVAVNPDKELRRWARHEAWPIVHLD